MPNFFHTDLVVFDKKAIKDFLTCLYTYRGGSRISGKGFINMYKGVGGWLCRFYLIFLKYLMKMKQFGLTETKLLQFHRIFKNVDGEGVQAYLLNPYWICH